MLLRVTDVICTIEAGNNTLSSCLHANGMFLCASGECIAHAKVCDGHRDCSAGDDEGNHCNNTATCVNHNCSQECFVSPRGNQCYCHDGYQLDPRDNRTCLDINECDEPGFCSQHCRNLQGHFICSCDANYR